MTTSKFLTYTETLPNGFSFDMRYIPGGTFDMGSNDDDLYGFDNEKPHRKNLFVAPVYIGVFPVTQALWKAVMGEENNPSNFKGDNRPVEKVSWLELKEFMTFLNAQTSEKRAKRGLDAYHLPTEAEWEFAARGGPFNAQHVYAGSDKLKEVGWFRNNSGNKTQEVGKRLPNALGLYDMSGNVWEWVEDHWYPDYENAPKDGRSWLTEDESALRVLRGGSYFNDEWDCHLAYRSDGAPGGHFDSLGFRLALSPSLEQPVPAIL